MQDTTKLIAVPMFALLAACGSSSGGEDVVDVIDVTPTTIDAFLDENGDVLDGVSRSLANEIINESGNVTYVGTIFGTLDGGDVIGSLALDVDFDSNQTSGSATEFTHSVDGDFGGELTGSAAVSADAQSGIPQISVVLTGDLERGATTFASELLLDGDFFGHETDQINVAAGQVEGNIGDVDIDAGLFFAQR